MRTGVPVGRMSNSSLISAFSSATQPNVQSLAVPPPWLKI
jgi:hypothetical protein